MNMKIVSWEKPPYLDLTCSLELELPQTITMLYIKMMRIRANK